MLDKNKNYDIIILKSLNFVVNTIILGISYVNQLKNKSLTNYGEYIFL